MRSTGGRETAEGKERCAFDVRQQQARTGLAAAAGAFAVSGELLEHEGA